MRKLVLILTPLLPMLLGATDGGIQVSDVPPNTDYPLIQLFPQIVESSLLGDPGGCIVAWEDNRNNCFEIYAQRLNGSGQRQWPNPQSPSDVLISSGFNQGHRMSLSMCEGYEGGAYIAFVNWHGVQGDAKLPGVYMQHIDADGTPRWGQPIVVYHSAQASYKGFPSRITDICNDDNGGCWIACLFNNSNGYRGVRCYHVNEDGDAGFVYGDSSTVYHYICPSICLEGDRAVVMCAKWSYSVSPNTVLFGASINANYSVQNMEPFEIGYPPPDARYYKKFLEIDVTPAGQNYVHVVYRKAEMKTPEVGGEFTFYHTREICNEHYLYNILSGERSNLKVMACLYLDICDPLPWIEWQPVEQLDYRCPVVIGNPNDYTDFICIFTERITSCDNHSLRPSSYRINVETRNYDWKIGTEGNYHMPYIIRDPSNPGGFLLAFTDYPSQDWAGHHPPGEPPDDEFGQNQNCEIVLMRLNSSGFPYPYPWGIKRLCDGFAGPRSSPCLTATNNNENVVIVWCDKRGAGNKWKIYAQNYELSSGEKQW